MRWSTWDTSVDRTFRGLDGGLRSRGRDDWGRRSIVGRWKLPHESAGLRIKPGFFVLEIAQAAKELGDATDEIRGCLAERMGL